jgi:O-succinylbenzoate synthase
MKVALYHDDVTFARSVVASAQNHEGRARLFLVLEHEGVTGYGEVAPQPFALNGDPALDEVLVALDVVLERLTGVLAREGALPTWSRVPRLVSTNPAALAAAALVEMAVLDWELRATGRVITELWPREHDALAQATVSLLDDDTEWVIDGDVARVRVKSAPGAVAKVALARLRALRVPVIIDFNCSVARDEEVLEQVAVISGVADVAAVEQPYDAGNLVDHARLATRLDVPLSLDEGVRGLRDVVNVAHYEAGRMICVKPARVGGLANARTMFVRAASLGLSAYLGGFFESPFARHVHRTFAESFVVEPSDVSDVALRSGEESLTSLEGGFGRRPSSVNLERARPLLLVGEGGP